MLQFSSNILQLHQTLNSKKTNVFCLIPSAMQITSSMICLSNKNVRYKKHKLTIFELCIAIIASIKVWGILNWNHIYNNTTIKVMIWSTMFVLYTTKRTTWKSFSHNFFFTFLAMIMAKLKFSNENHMLSIWTC